MADGQGPAETATDVIATSPPTLQVVAVEPTTLQMGAVEMRSTGELPPEIADEIGRFVDPRCGRCDCQIFGQQRERGRCDRCYEDESTENAISDVNGRYREDFENTPMPLRSAIARLIYGAQVWRDRLAIAQRQLDGPALVGNEYRPGKRYLPLVPVYDTARQPREIIGWQILPHTVSAGIGLHGDRIYKTPEAARASVQARQRHTVRVLEIDIVDQPDVDLTPAQRHEHAERMVFRWTEEMTATRPAAIADQSTKDRGGDLVMPPTLRTMALNAHRTTELTNGPHCLQCANNLKEIGLPFCIPCAATVLDVLGRAVSVTASMMGQMEATGPAAEPERTPEAAEVVAEAGAFAGPNVGEPLEITDLGNDPL